MVDDVQARVVEVLRVGGGRGSGFAVAADLVLTAAHVVAGDTVVRVLVGEEELSGLVVWSDADLDAALVRVSFPRWDGIDTRWAIVSGLRPVACTAIGYPKVQKTGEGKRVEEQLAGFIMPATGRRIGRYAINITSALPYERVGRDSPWSGLSGAAVLTADGHHVVGVLTDDPTDFEPARLEAVPVDQLLNVPEFADLVGVAPAELTTVSGTPGPSPRGVVEQPARRIQPHWWRDSGYVEQVGDIAPLQLLDRAAELAELAAWCARGDESYVWWQAGPWAGKSALLAWLVLHPPPGVWVVSFFVTARLSGQADSTAFNDALLDQLARMTGEQVPPITSSVARDRLRRQLLNEAAARAAQENRRLILIVDGLDEDCGSLPGSGLPSIAASLPRRPPEGLRIIVAGRPDPRLPADVDVDHPLRRCRVRRLDPSPHAAQVTELAQRELNETLAVDPHRHGGLGYQVLGLVTASGGGLSGRDLQQLTGRPAFEIDRLLHGVFGRTIAGRADPHTADRGFMFTHETLRVEAIDRLGAHLLSDFQQRIHAWADGYQDRGWPAETPSYLLHGYPRMIADLRDSARLVALASDPVRHRRLLNVTGGDSAALADIAMAFSLLVSQPAPDVPAALRLAWHRDHLIDRNTKFPTRLPAIWVMLGQPTRGEALARSITDPQKREEALVRVARAAAETGDHRLVAALADEAETIVSSPDVYARAAMLTGLAKAAAGIGDFGRAEAILSSVGPPAMLERALAELAVTAGRFGDLGVAATFVERAEAIVLSYDDAGSRTHGLAELARTVASLGDHRWASTLADRAATSARSITNPWSLAELAEAATVDDPRQASTLAYRAEAAARYLTKPVERARVLVQVTATVAGLGDRGRAMALAKQAEAVARSVLGRGQRAHALTSLISAVAATGDHRGAAALADQAEAVARSIMDAERQAYALRGLVEAIAGAGDLDRAETLARSIADPGEQAIALSGVIQGFAGAGDLDRAETVARSITDPVRRTYVLRRLVEVIADAGHLDRAEAVARSITDPDWQAYALRSLVASVADTGDFGRAETLAQSITQPNVRAHALTSLVEATADAGDLDRAETIIRSVTDPDLLTDVLVKLATARAASGDHLRAATLADRAETIARSIVDRTALARTLAGLACTVAAAGELDRAEMIAGAITDAATRAKALAELVQVAVGRGDLDRAVTIAGSIGDVTVRAQTLAQLVRAVAGRGDLDRAVTIAGSIGDVTMHAQTLAELAQAVASSDLDRAETIAGSIADGHARPQALADLAIALAGRGYLDQAAIIARGFNGKDPRAQALTKLAAAVATVDVAAGIARSFVDENWRAQALTGLATVVAGRRDLDRAAKIARSVPGRDAQARALTGLAKAAAEAGDLDEAATIARSVPGKDARAQALTSVATIAAEVGDLHRAETIARSIAYPDARAHMLAALAAVVARAGDLAWADLIARSMTNPGPQARAFTDLATVATGAGDRRRAAAFADEAETTVGSINNWIRWVEATAYLVVAKAHMGDPDGAEEIARGIADPDKQAQVLTALAVAVSGLGDLARAEKIARSITTPDAQAQALTKVAGSAPPAKARMLVASALATGRWSTPLKVLLRTDPSAVHAFLDDHWDLIVGRAPVSTS